MHISALTAPEQRILGCLIEKKFTTPDQYPLSINALRLAANQSTNRDPVVSYDDHTVNEAAQRLSRYGLVRLASGHSSRATKYRHLADEALGVDPQQLSVLCVLLLRGPQTPGELKGRTERMASYPDLDAVDAGLEALAGRGYVARLARRPGQKEERWGHLFGDASAEAVAEDSASLTAAAPQPAPPTSSVAAPAAAPDVISALTARVAALETEVAELRGLLES